ncbi:MAG TPA: hypothetical protein VJT49_15180 [Amycolatopsis sp.]|uniref:hypothetical protein n=1 Tax=Amycolatopsis sp. TaxID=37632 RepID=UPI002B497E42|nr:hypothetical protein [Amycolatopsis sp.]HKS46422.1 hypothetical protein [Amycolatopsis sp.]
MHPIQPQLPRDLVGQARLFPPGLPVTSGGQLAPETVDWSQAKTRTALVQAAVQLARAKSLTSSGAK